MKAKHNVVPTLIMLVILAALIAWFISTGDDIAQAKAENAALTKQISEINSANAALRAEIASAADPDTQANYARAHLGYVLPGEIVFRES